MGKGVRSPDFPAFQPSGKSLCGKKFIALRQEINFFQQRISFLCAQKRRKIRRNVRIRHFSGFVFNNWRFFRFFFGTGDFAGMSVLLSFCKRFSLFYDVLYFFVSAGVGAGTPDRGKGGLSALLCVSAPEKCVFALVCTGLFCAIFWNSFCWLLWHGIWKES